MKTRSLRASDLPILRAMAERSGYPYPDPDGRMIEACLVVVNENDQPVMACAAERIVQLYLWAGEFEHPAAKQHAIRLIHRDMPAFLKPRGYNSCEAFLPPALVKIFGRRLERTFSWIRNWPSWTKHF